MTIRFGTQDCGGRKSGMKTGTKKAVDNKDQPPIDPGKPALECDLLTPGQVAALLRVSVNRLAQLRCKGDGPPYMKMGRLVRYPRLKLRAWIEVWTTNNASEQPSKPSQ